MTATRNRADLIELIASVIDPRPYHPDPDERHRLCSPRTVDAVLDEATLKADDVLNRMEAAGIMPVPMEAHWTMTDRLRTWRGGEVITAPTEGGGRRVLDEAESAQEVYRRIVERNPFARGSLRRASYLNEEADHNPDDYALQKDRASANRIEKRMCPRGKGES